MAKSGSHVSGSYDGTLDLNEDHETRRTLLNDALRMADIEELEDTEEEDDDDLDDEDEDEDDEDEDADDIDD